MLSLDVQISTVPCSLPRREQQSEQPFLLFYLIFLLEVLEGTEGDKGPIVSRSLKRIQLASCSRIIGQPDIVVYKQKITFFASLDT